MEKMYQSQGLKEHNKKQFLNKLSNLLKEYDAEIHFDCGDGSDTHGIYNEEIKITINNETIHSNSGWWLEI